MSDDELAMAYADGALDPIAAKRFEARMAEDAALAAAVAEHRALRAQLTARFGPIAGEPVPATLAALIAAEPVALYPRPRWRSWQAGAAVAASLVVGVLIGQGWQAPGGVSEGQPMATAGLAKALDTQLADAGGTTRMLASFRDASGAYCRVFSSAGTDGIACHQAGGWAIRRLDSGGAAQTTQYRQAGSRHGAVMAAAQEMMAGDPLDPAGERAARDKGWR